jgi:hypothetical protein
MLVVNYVERGYTSKSGSEKLMKNHNAPLCQCLYFIEVYFLVYDLKSHKNHTYWCWSTNHALNVSTCFELVFPHLGYIDTTQTPSEYHDWECKHRAQARCPSILLENLPFIWGHPPFLSARDLLLNPVCFHLNFFCDWPRALVSYPNQSWWNLLVAYRVLH